jgi:hypothetical protein
MQKIQNATTEYQQAFNMLCDIETQCLQDGYVKREKFIMLCVMKLMYLHSQSFLTQSESWDLLHQAYHMAARNFRE